MSQPAATRRWRSAGGLLMALGTVLLLGTGSQAATEAAEPDVCVAVAPGVLTEVGWAVVLASVELSVSERPALFPAPVFVSAGPALAEPGDPAHLRITADGAGLRADAAPKSCLEGEAQWTMRVGRPFLDLGADRMLAVAPTTPGIDSDVDVEWYPDESRVLTMLRFAGPLDIPNGRCWIDDVLGVDAAQGQAVSSAGQGLETSPFAESACGRFFDYLVDGGAGEQALHLLPRSVLLGDGSLVAFVAERVTVASDAIVISGSIELR